MSMGFPPGTAERDCAHPVMTRPIKPIAIFCFMSEDVSILGEFQPREARNPR
jgi:hypothetical protein